MSDEQDETERVPITTYVPRYQKEEWEADAEELDMSLSEFFRSMVQAGRRGFDLTEPEMTRAELRDEVLAGLRAVDHLTWEEMVAALPPEASEEALERVLGELQNRGDVTVRRGGLYTAVEE